MQLAPQVEQDNVAAWRHAIRVKMPEPLILRCLDRSVHYVKYSRWYLLVALAVGLGAGAVAFWPSKDKAITPSPWIVEAAIALNRAAIVSIPHGGTEMAAGDQSAARQLALKGQRLRVQRRFDEAQAAYQEAVKADPTDADSWADLADCAASAAGNDLTKGRDAIMRALAIDPQHRKALWLRASLELQEQQYSAAAATWRELESLVAAGSTDARVIAANIVEADALARTAAPDGRGS
jgi:cytochrome c-type biogenesis protein CcmH